MKIRDVDITIWDIIFFIFLLIVILIDNRMGK